MKLFKNHLILVLLVLVAVGAAGCSNGKTQPPTAKPSSSAKIVNLTDIAGKSEVEVAKILGNPISKTDGTFCFYGTSQTISNCPTLRYQRGITIKFIEGKAARITIIPTMTLNYDDYNKSLEILGLTPAAPAVKELSTMTWKSLDGIYQFRIFDNEGKVDYMYAIVDERYR